MTAATKTMQPTSQRLRHAAGAFLAPEISQTKSRRAFRMVSAVEGLHRDGKIDDRQFQAFRRFESDWETAETCPQITARYDDFVDKSHDGGTMAEARRILAGSRAGQALGAIASREGRRALAMSVMGSPEGCPYTLEAIGRACWGHKTSALASCAGRVVLSEALAQLVVHYDST